MSHPTKARTPRQSPRSTLKIEAAILQAYYVIKAAQEREELQREAAAAATSVAAAAADEAALHAASHQLLTANGHLGDSYR